MKIVNCIERYNFCLNDLLPKSNRTEIQTYEVEERTFGTPCILSILISNVVTYTTGPKVLKRSYDLNPKNNEIKLQSISAVQSMLFRFNRPVYCLIQSSLFNKHNTASLCFMTSTAFCVGI